MIVLALTLAAVDDLQARFYLTGTALYELCTADERSKQLSCLSYIEGASDALGTAVKLIGQPLFCTAQGVSVGQEKDVVVGYLRDHPTDRHQSAGVLTAIALTIAFPCPTGS
jgi:hypothetical protein